MALLIDRKAIGRADSIIASDLSDKMSAIAIEQRYTDEEIAFDIGKTRLWVNEYAGLASRGFEVAGVACEDTVVDTVAGRVALRFYNPDERSVTVLFVHGGGWVIGDIRSHDHIARWLAAETGARIVQLDYALAPERPYPASLDQVSSVLRDLIAEGAGRILIAGDSAGANLASMAILALTPEQRGRLAGFVSIYGAYAPEMNLSSHRLYGDGRFGLSEAQMRWFWNLYAPQLPAEERARRLSPLTADLSGFPPTLCIGAECDLLLDDTLAFYGELTKARVDVSLALWPSLPHGCLHFVGAVPSVTEAASSIVRFVTARGRQSVASRPETEKAHHAEGTIEVEPLFSVSRSRLHGSLAHRIANEILAGNLAPGALLPREESANEAYGVSRSAYREAIRTLAAKGMVAALPKVGTKVAPRALWHVLDPDLLAWRFDAAPSESFIRNLFELRKIVEPSAAALAAMRRSDEELSRLADALSRMARTSPRSGGWLNALIAFHQELMTASRNEAVASLWPAIQTTIRWSMRLQMMLPDLVLGHDPVADHARVFERIASQSAEGTLTEMALLIESALEDTLSNMARVAAMENTMQAHKSP